MYISNRQIEAVVKTLIDNEHRISDGYDHYCGYDGNVKEVLKEIAMDIISNLNKVIYNGT